MDNHRATKNLYTIEALLIGRDRKQIKGKFFIQLIPARQQDKLKRYLSSCRHEKHPGSPNIEPETTGKVLLPVQIRSFPPSRKQHERTLYLVLLDFCQYGCTELK